MKKVLIWLAVVLGCACSAPPKPAPGALAAVGEEQIAPEDLRRFEAEMDPAHRSPKKGIEAHREHLQSLIDIELMIREALALKLDRDPELALALEHVRQGAMVDAYLHNRLAQNVQLTEQQMRASFEAHPASQAVRGAHILLATREQAEEALAEIRAGQSFEEVARRRSLDRQTAAKGGAFDKYYAFDRVSDQIYEKVFKAMKVGEISAPFRTNQGYEIVKVLDKKQLDYEKYRPVVMRGVIMQEIEDRKTAHVARLLDSLGAQLEPASLHRLLEAWNAGPGHPEFSPQEEEAPLYRFAGGQLTIGEALPWLAPQRTGLDSAQVELLLWKKALPEVVLALVAARAGFAADPEVERSCRQERQRRLLEALWKKKLEDEVVATATEARAHYQAHPEVYQAPEEIVIQEILVPTRQEAEALLAQVRGGADMGVLAAAHSIRMHADKNNGVYGMRAFERMIYKEVMGAALRDSSGGVVGPVRVDRPLPSALKGRDERAEAYSLFKVLERLPARLRPFEEVVDQSFFYARQEKQQQRLDALEEELRHKYKGQWAVDEEALRSYGQTLASE
ncbi:MAG: peptidylprolyl isomerase [Candidatus Latescibacteria bacterium]|nr:peptidylprolyl isomerase [Candidatus Latescibacterota bacterium]